MNSSELFDKWLKEYGTGGWRVAFERNPNGAETQKVMDELQTICELRADELCNQSR